MKFDLLSPFPVCTQLLLTGVSLQQGSFTKLIHKTQSNIAAEIPVKITWWFCLLQVESVSQKMTRIRIVLRQRIVPVLVSPPVHWCVLGGEDTLVKKHLIVQCLSDHPLLNQLCLCNKTLVFSI